jgi:hypothetical protein
MDLSGNCLKHHRIGNALRVQHVDSFFKGIEIACLGGQGVVNGINSVQWRQNHRISQPFKFVSANVGRNATTCVIRVSKARGAVNIA